ncbi:MAG: hypothetical protein KY475_11135 [Planctomycetes bacterium]|nr:hypothetical protein [Planctomycetota bacterium]
MAAPAWNQYLRLSLRASGNSVWASPDLQLAKDNRVLVERLFEHLDQSLKYDPDNARANYRMAVTCLRRFDIVQQESANAMSLMQIRDAALASDFAAREDQDHWLQAALGENREYLERAQVCLHRSLRLCPLQGEAYLGLAETAFLNGWGHSTKQAYIAQAERLRPYDGNVLLAAGQEAMLAGDHERALERWKRAYHLDAESRQRVIELLAPNLPARQFVEFFEPDSEGVNRLYYQYAHLNRREDAEFLAERLVVHLESEAERRSGASAASLWHRAAELRQYLHQRRRAKADFEQAMRAAPGQLAIRRAYAFHLLQLQEFDLAAQQFRQCLRHHPDDESARAGLTRALRESRSHRISRLKNPPSF